MTIISSRFEIDIIYMDRGLFHYAISSSDIPYIKIVNSGLYFYSLFTLFYFSFLFPF